MYIFTHLPVWTRGGSTQGTPENHVFIISSVSLFLFALCALLLHRFASVPPTPQFSSQISFLAYRG